MKRPKIIAKAIIKKRDGYIHYKLIKTVISKNEFYLVFVSYRGESRLCPLELKGKTATEIFTSIIRTRTTPLSLYDSIYDLQK